MEPHESRSPRGDEPRGGGDADAVGAVEGREAPLRGFADPRPRCVVERRSQLARTALEEVDDVTDVGAKPHRLDERVDTNVDEAGVAQVSFDDRVVGEAKRRRIRRRTPEAGNDIGNDLEGQREPGVPFSDLPHGGGDTPSWRERGGQARQRRRGVGQHQRESAHHDVETGPIEPDLGNVANHVLDIGEPGGRRPPPTDVGQIRVEFDGDDPPGRADAPSEFDGLIARTRAYVEDAVTWPEAAGRQRLPPESAKHAVVAVRLVPPRGIHVFSFLSPPTLSLTLLVDTSVFVKYVFHMVHGHRSGGGRHGRGPSGARGAARCRWLAGGGAWEVHARIERFVEPSLLLLLRDGETHGYDLADALAEIAGPDERIDMGNLYRTLRALEFEGIVTSRWRDDLPGRTKRTYELTEVGERLLDAWAEALRSNQRVIVGFLDRYERKDPS